MYYNATSKFDCIFGDLTGFRFQNCSGGQGGCPKAAPREISPSAFAVPPFLNGFSPLLRSTPQWTTVHNSTPSTEHDCLIVQTKPRRLLRDGQNRSQ